MNFRLLGQISALLLLIQILPYTLNFLNRKFFKTKSPGFRTLMKWLRKTHKYTGALLVLIAAIHGFMVLGSFRLHTGTLLYLLVIVTALAGYGFHVKKKKEILQMHRLLAGIMVLLFFLHYFAPWALSNF